VQGCRSLPQSAATSDVVPADKSKRLGEYCLVEK
jgi:hypothetical protein